MSERTPTTATPTPPQDLTETVARALAEDIGAGDLTAELIPAGTESQARVISREPAVICGRPWFDEVFWQLSDSVQVDWAVEEGETVEPDAELCRLSGAARAILTGERTALNFLQTLSGTATRTRAFVEAIEDTGAQILDTRKTLPGLRLAQKYAVACAGGRNHRKGLYDGILIKENHIIAAGSIGAAIDTAKRLHPDIAVEVETENLDELDQALAAGADVIMLDDYPLEDMREAVRRNAGRAKLEVSGGIDLQSVRAIAETGVDFISIGGLTKHLTAIDLSMRFQL
jgi:nicotinate-nucleotide pyrophosphorylase (carboxylating)